MRQKRTTPLVASALFALNLLGTPVSAEGAQEQKAGDHSSMDHSQMDHSQMDHSASDVAKGVMVMEMSDFDEDGRRVGLMDHDHLDMVTIEALQDKIDVYKAFTPNEIRINMAMMGPNYEWYVSDRSLQGDVGVLILCHGVGEKGDRHFVEAVKPVGDTWPTAVGFGMAMMTSDPLQQAVDDLVARGAKKIVLVPALPTRFNSLYRQWDYAFGQGAESAYLDIPPIETEAELIMADALNDDPLLTDVLYDYANEISSEPSNEVVIIIGHGPEDIEENIPDLEMLSPHTDRLKEMGGFQDVKMINLQDDALAPIRAANVKKLRKWITTAERQGYNVLILGLVLESHGLQATIVEDLRGLSYEFNTRGLADHPKTVEWISATVERALASPDEG